MYMSIFPLQTGNFCLVRQWNETLGMSDGIYFHYSANPNETGVPFVVASCPKAFSDETEGKIESKILTTPFIIAGQHDSTQGRLGPERLATRQEGPTAKALCALHLMDDACWQVLPNGVPKVCKLQMGSIAMRDGFP